MSNNIVAIIYENNILNNFIKSFFIFVAPFTYNP